MDRQDSGYAEMDTPDPRLGVSYRGVLRALPEDATPQSDQVQRGRGEKAGGRDATDPEDSHRNSVFLSEDDGALVHRGALCPRNQAHPWGTNTDHGLMRSADPATAHRGQTRIQGPGEPQGELSSTRDRDLVAQKGVSYRTLDGSGSLERTRSDTGPTRVPVDRLHGSQRGTRAPRYRKNSMREAVFFHEDSVDSVASSDSYDINGDEDVGNPSTPHEPDDESIEEMEDEEEDVSQMVLRSSDHFVYWHGLVSSPLPKNAVIRSNSVSIPLSKRSLPDLVKESKFSRWSQPVFQYATLERRRPLVGSMDVSAEGESWGQGQSSSKSESDLRLLEEERESPSSMTRAMFHASNPGLSTRSADDTLESFDDRTHEGFLWLNNIPQGTQTETWCIIHRGTLLMFESIRPQSRILERWRLVECKVTPVPQKVALDLLVKFSIHHSFQIRRATEKKSVTIFSSMADYLCKEWIQKLTAASNTFLKRKGSRLSFPTFSLKAHFAKSAKRKSKGPSPAPMMTRKSFDDIYGWSEEQSHKRAHKMSGPAKENVQRSKTEKMLRATDEGLYRLRASSDTDLSRQAKKEPVDRSASAESSKGGGMFDSLRKTLKKPAPQSKQLGSPSTSATRAHPPLKMTQSIPLEPSVRAGLLLVKRFSSWNRCWVKLQGTNLHFFRDRPDQQLPFVVLSLTGYEVHCIPPSPNPGGQVRFKFSLVCQDKESIHFLADTELDGRLWVKRFMEACTTSNLGTMDKSPSSSNSTKSGEAFDDADHNCNDNSDASCSPTESPQLRKRRVMIQKRYQEANETEEMNAMKRSLILNQRRMSAQSKLEALDKQFGKRLAREAKNKKRNKSSEKKGREGEVECDDASIKELLKELHRKVRDIDRELGENILRSDQRKQALLKKQEMELEILQQERELLKYRTQAQAALKSMMTKSSSGGAGSQKQLHHPPLGLLEERMGEDPGSLDSTINDPEFTNGSYGQLQRKNRNSPSVSSSMSSLSSSGTSDSSGTGSNHSSSRFSPRVERVRLSNRGTDSVDGPGQLTVNRPIRERQSPAVSTPDLRRVCDRIPENGFPIEAEGSVEAPAILVTPSIRQKQRTEVPPDVLRDIDDFEEMAKLALKKAGWLPLDEF